LVGQKGFGYEKIAELIKKYSLNDHVIHLGYINDEDLPVIYSGAKVFAFLSLYEGFGLPLLEAMACGVPVVAASTSSLPEVVGDAGILVNPYDVKAISESIWKILSNKRLRNELIRKGIERAKLFTWSRAASMTYDILKAYQKR